MIPSINIKGNLREFTRPMIMGILNVTPDSFYSGSRKQTEKEICERIEAIFNEGGEIVDIGGYSSRPSAIDISVEEELSRLETGLKLIKQVNSDAIISIDTFRAEVAKACVEKHGADIINDISGGTIDANMFETIAQLQVPYIMMHMRGTPQTMQQFTHYDHLMDDIMTFFAERINMLTRLKVNDIIVDPGFGFSKTVQQNFELMHNINEFKIFQRPVLVGISRKSMIYKTLETTAEQSLNGTTVLNTFALLGGAHLLRVHDVKEAVETVKLLEAIKNGH